MRTLFLGWQDRKGSRRWYPIGRLDADVARSDYRFLYTRGADEARRHAGLTPLEAFPDLETIYESSDLFPLFRNRVPGAGRGDFGDYVRRLDLDPGNTDPVEILSVSGGERITDSLEVFPKIERAPSGRFSCRFFLHGWNHVHPSGRSALEELSVGDELQVAAEANSPTGAPAIQLQTRDYRILGWAPRYLARDLRAAFDGRDGCLRARVAKLNPSPAPTRQRALIEASGTWPQDYEPMSSPDYQPLRGADLSRRN